VALGPDPLEALGGAVAGGGVDDRHGYLSPCR
jgi:hypothetical protein